MRKNNPNQIKTTFQQKITLILFGLFLFLVILEIGLRIGGFVFLSLQEHRNKVSMAKKGTYRILCLGESTTAIFGTQLSYPSQLEEILNQRKIRIRFSIINKGVTGIKTSGILTELENNLDKYKPDMVTAMIGINDSGIHLPYDDDSHYKTKVFLKSFRSSKLARLLWLHLLTKMKKNVISKDYLSDKEEMFKKAIKINPGNDKPYLELGWYYYNDMRLYAKSEEMFKKAIEINSRGDEAYIGLGYCYKNSGKYLQAEEMFKKAIEVNPTNIGAYIKLGWRYHSIKKNVQAEEMFKKAIEVNPTSVDVYIGLGRYYLRIKRYAKSEEMLKKAIELAPTNAQRYIDLALCYKNSGKYLQAEEMLKKGVEVNLAADRIYASLETLYNEEGKYELAKEYREKAKNRYYKVTTIKNYQRVKEILDRRGIKLVCIQYPVRSIEPLKMIFEGEDGIIFVDNEKIFKDVLKKEPYSEYFKDIFGGDFGHCTTKGNRLLAENIANTILKEYFNK